MALPGKERIAFGHVAYALAVTSTFDLHDDVLLGHA
jgi:hypothetical protein